MNQRGRGRPRVHASPAARCAAYRKRVKWNASTTKGIVDALTLALDDGRCSYLVDDLPDNEADAAAEICKRLAQVRLVAYKRTAA